MLAVAAACLVTAGVVAACGTASPGMSGSAVGDPGRMRPDSVIGQVWEDGNGDGVRSGSESGVPGLAVSLWLDNGDGLCGSDDQQLGSTVTAEDGTYAFEYLEVGSYCVQVNSGTASSQSAVGVLASGGTLNLDVPAP